MKSKKSPIYKLSIATATLGLVAISSIVISGQNASTPHEGVPEDWTHHHAVFANPGTFADALKKGRLEDWNRITSDPRYKLQQLKRNVLQRQLQAAPDFAARMEILSRSAAMANVIVNKQKRPVPTETKKDWSMDMGLVDGAEASVTEGPVGTPGTTGGQTITITNPNNSTSMTLYATPTTSTATGTAFGTGGFPEGASITIASGSNTYLFALAGEGTVSFSGTPSQGDTVAIGSLTYTFGSHSYCTATGHPNNCVYYGTSSAFAAQNLNAALLDAGASNCGDTSSSACYWSVSANNPNVSNTYSGSAVTLTNSSTNTAITTFSESSSVITLFPAISATTGVITAAITTGGTCGGASPAYVGGVLSSTSASAQAADFDSAVSACTSLTAVTTTHASGTVTLTAASGTGTAATLSASFTGFTWSPTTLSYSLASSNTYPNFQTNSSASTEASNIASEIASNGSSVGVTASANSPANGDVIFKAASDGSAGDNLTVASTVTGFTFGSTKLAGGADDSPGTLAAGQLPAKYSFSTTATPSCSDYVVYGTGLPGGSSQATVIAYTDLYATTCGSTVPVVDWAYNTGGAAALSPVLSGDGTQVAYVQTASSVASLVVLKMANSGGTADSPAAITSVGNSAYPACSAPCYTTISLSANDTNSPPFYDYTNDVVYVGDDSGNLHKFANVFNGTATNYLTSSWSTNVSSADGTKYGSSAGLSAPVLDPVTGLIFVGDRYGYLHSVNSSGGGLATSGQLGNVTAGGPGINDGPLIDVEGSTSNVYVFVQNTNSSKFTYINEFPTGTALSGYGTAVGFSGVSGTQLLYDGAFDNQWYTSGGTSGNLYVCGVDSTNSAYPTLFQVPLPLTAGTSGKANTYAPLANAAAGCSPPTEFYNGTSDYLFVSVTGSGTATGCSGACMYSFILPANTTTHTGTASAGLSVTGGSSGIAIDNSGTATGESQIYFSTLGSQSCAGTTITGSGTGGCAVQASQSGLH